MEEIVTGLFISGLSAFLSIFANGILTILFEKLLACMNVISCLSIVLYHLSNRMGAGGNFSVFTASDFNWLDFG